MTVPDMTDWFRHGSRWAVRTLTAALLSVCVPVSMVQAQEATRNGGSPLVQDVTFAGAEELSESALQNHLATRPTRCRGVLLLPFCLFTDGAVVTERNHLNEDELPRDELRLRVVYFREGFRETSVTSEVRDDPNGVEVRFHLVEGAPTLVETLEVRQTREVLSGNDIEGAGLPGEGEPLSLNDIAQGMEHLTEELQERGYLDAVVRDTIEVSPQERLARVEVEIDPGPLAVVREFDVRGNDRIEEETIILALHLEEGDVITRPLIRQSRAALHQSNLFYEADVRVPEQPDSAKVVEVHVREAPPRLGRIGGGFSTLEFGQVEGRFSHYNWLGRGRLLDLRASVGNLLAPQLTGRLFFRNILPDELAGVDESPFRVPTWQVSADFQQPAFRGAENLLAIGVFANRRVIPGVSVDRGVGSEVSLIRRLAFRVPLNVSYRYELTAVEAGDVFFCINFGVCQPASVDALRGRNSLSPLSVGFHIDRADDPLGPTTGYRVRLDVEHASGPTLSDYRYHRASGEASYYQPFAGPPRHVLAARLRAGWVEPLESTARAVGVEQLGQALLHPRKRFFAGGARSVRGYAENQLGPRILTIPRESLLAEDRCQPEEIADRTCDPSLAPVDAFVPRPLGGTSVLEANVEYRLPVGDATLAFFLDGALVGGRLGAFVQGATGALTPGFGARFDSPAGPIRIDVGLRPRTAALLPVVTERDLPDEPGRRELVQLDQRRRFDPLEDEGTLGRILGRLTLHFSIGEAF